MIAELLAGRFNPKLLGNVVARATGLGSLGVAQVEPPNAEASRSGRRFLLGMTGAPTGIAPVQALPTTAAQWVLWNTDPSVTDYYEELGLVLVSGTPGLGGSLWAALVKAPAQVGASAAGMAAQNASLGARATNVVVKSGVTLTSPAAPVWFQLAESADTVAAAAFSTGYANGLVRRDLAGAIAVPPGYGIALVMIAPAGTTPLYAPLGRWVEYESDNE